MSGILPSFASGSNLVIRLGKFPLAYATNLTFTDDVASGAIGGIGSYSYDGIEPLQYAARGAMSITRYTREALNAIKQTGNGGTSQASRRANDKDRYVTSKTLGNTIVDPNDGEGNSLLTSTSFNPFTMMVSRTFDIEVYERKSSTEYSRLVFVCKDCRLTSYSMSFTPGSLVAEQVGFIATRIEDSVAVSGLSFDPETVTGG
jgi:hypothetical protein